MFWHEQGEVLKKGSWYLFRTYAGPYWPRTLALLGLLLLTIGFQLAGPKILQVFIDAALPPLDGADPAADGILLRLAALFLGIGFAGLVANAVAAWVGADLGWRCTNDMRSDLARHALSLDTEFHYRETPGSMIERVDGDVTALSNFFSQLFIQLATGFCLTVGVLVMVFLENRLAGVVLAGFAIVALLVIGACRNLGVPETLEHRRRSALLFGMIEERLAGLEDIRANGGGPAVLERFYRLNRSFYHLTRWAWMLRTFVMALVFFMFALAELLVLGLGAWLYLRDQLSLGTVLLFYQYTRMLISPIQQITRQVQDLQKAWASIGRINELLGQKPKMAEGEGTLPAAPLSVSFDDVSFAYVPGTPVLKGLSLDIPGGTSLAIVGRTGSGKTTLARLLTRLHDPDQGHVAIAGMDLRSLERRSMRCQVAMVSQDVRLFQGSLLQNLTFFDESISEDRVEKILHQLGLQEWVHSFPQGVHSQILGSRRQLSAGEAQLLALARSFLRDPQVVILDEPSSRLDPVTDSLLQRALRTMMKGRTVIIIAHRLQTVQEADRILVLEDGRRTEFGLRAELEARPDSRYRQLLEKGLEVDAI